MTPFSQESVQRRENQKRRQRYTLCSLSSDLFYRPPHHHPDAFLYTLSLRSSFVYLLSFSSTTSHDSREVQVPRPAVADDGAEVHGGLDVGVDPSLGSALHHPAKRHRHPRSTDLCRRDQEPTTVRVWRTVSTSALVSVLLFCCCWRWWCWGLVWRGTRLAKTEREHSCHSVREKSRTGQA